MIERRGARPRSVEAVVSCVAPQKEPIVGLAVEALHVRGSRPPPCFHRRADKRGMLDIAEPDQLLSRLQILSDTNRKLGKPRELAHLGSLPGGRYCRTRGTNSRSPACASVRRWPDDVVAYPDRQA